MVLGLLDGFNDVLVEPFVANRAVVSLDVGVLLRLAGLDVLDRDAPFLGPDQQLPTDVFRAVVDPGCSAATVSLDKYLPAKPSYRPVLHRRPPKAALQQDLLEAVLCHHATLDAMSS